VKSRLVKSNFIVTLLLNITNLRDLNVTDIDYGFQCKTHSVRNR
jgi:hypothetical protein